MEHNRKESAMKVNKSSNFDTGIANSMPYQYSHNTISTVMDKLLEESFLIGGYPASTEGYWRVVLERKIDVGVQLEVSKYYLSYHDDLPDFVQQRSIATNPLGNCTIRTYIVNGRPFSHISYKWPDLGIPTDYKQFTEFMRSYLGLIWQGSLVLVHCREGHGRSGTFAFVRALMKRPEASLEVSNMVLNELRRQREGLVETSRQEQFARDIQRSLSDSLPVTR